MSYTSKYTGQEIDNLLDVAKGLNIEETILWEGEVTTEGAVVNLSDSIENYNHIVVYNGYYNKSGYKRVSPYSTFSVEYILKEGYNEETLYLNDNGSVNARNEWTAHSNFWVIAPTQIKLAVSSISNGEIGLAYVDRIVGIKLNPVTSENDYSTEERRVGTWIDGKPIYRKVITGYRTLATSTDGTQVINPIDVSNLNVDSVVSLTGTMISNVGLSMPTPAFRPGSAYGVLLFHEQSTKTVNISNYCKDLGNRDVTIIFEYTKTTD